MNGTRGVTHDDKTKHRIDTLKAHLQTTYGFDVVPVFVPHAQRSYAILRPSVESVDRMFEEAPKHLQPFWTRVWPSGVALADVALAWRSRLQGQRVLELGSGLGVTACAAAEAGATVIAADFSQAALMYCRLNTLVNTGKGIRTLPPLDWRNPTNVAASRLDACGEFSVVLGADVLYESGDILPLMKLIDRVLTPDGTLLLAEPGRKTAERFLYRMAAEGWHGESKTVQLPWSKDATEEVNVHVLHRPQSSDWLRASLGGWRA
jgi:predicted nicotinamide N-methyase